VIKHLGFAFPAPILGMLILALALYFGIIPEKLMQGICDLLLKNMPLFFVPLFVGIVSYSYLIKQNLLPIVLIVFFTTFLAMLITAFLVQYIIKITDKGEIE
jgi:holin-like protein